MVLQSRLINVQVATDFSDEPSPVIQPAGILTREDDFRC